MAERDQDPLSPAIRLKKRKSFDIDLVPGIKLDGWPEVSRDLKPLKILDTYKDRTQVYHVVPKSHHSGKFAHSRKANDYFIAEHQYNVIVF